ncbi:phosphate/phosphite/phosphonate ABC transporter substrate-binding protein [Solibacillus sp. FSL W7-1464]|uniref:substrate-binding domain-containing protein n=1 Tax=Solibacillus sp. FSL W7-1464 TaxID=2921706 RepID=UPI0030FCDFEF
MRKIYMAIPIIVLIILILGCRSNPSTYQIVFSEYEKTTSVIKEDKKDPIRLAISSVLSPTDTIIYYREIVNYIGKKLDRPTILIQRRSYNEVSNLMMNGGADIALLPTGAYITFGANGGFEGIATQERFGSPYYYGYIVAKDENRFSSIDDLEGKDIAFFDPSSYSGYIFVKEELERLGEDIDSFFGRHIYTYSHEGSMNAVLNNIVDAAAVNSLVFETMKNESPEQLESLKIIGKSMPLGTGPVVISSNLPEEDKEIIKESFLSMHEQESMKQAIQGLYIDRFIPFDSEYYEVLYELDK